jgi:parvulin-like peptidyl-prolyl isomerase
LLFNGLVIVTMVTKTAICAAYLVFIAPFVQSAFTGSAMERIYNDLNALTRRVTARHILLPANKEVALALKQRIRNQSTENNRFVVDVFEEAAKKYSQDETTKYRGGLLGELVAQGYCRNTELDRACFEVRLGEIEGPLETNYGYHLLLVSERTNCPKLDGTKTKLVRSNKSGLGTLVESEQVGKINLAKFAVDQITFWLFACVAGGVLAEIAAQFANNLPAQ